MSSAWLLPEQIADVLPSEARRIEALRGAWLDMAQRCGFELVMPPLIEHLESLLSGTGRDLDLQTFKVADPLSGRMLGVRADTTPQVARLDAHLLNREGVTRLCYCGPVLRTRSDGLHGTREPLQFGAEVYGHAGLEAELEVIDLALDGLRESGVHAPVLDLGDARIVRGVLAGVPVDAQRLADVVSALAAKDAGAVASLARGFAPEARHGLQALLSLYGDDDVLERARSQLPERAEVAAALDDLARLAERVRLAHPHVQLGYDLADMRGYAYYSGVRFAVYGAGANDALLRGGRYDEVGAVFGRNRPAVGFSFDVKQLAGIVPARAPAPAIRAPWGHDEALRTAIRALRERGETVICRLPGHEHESDGYACDRELVAVDGRWLLRAC